MKLTLFILACVVAAAAPASFQWDMPAASERINGHTMYHLRGTNWVRIWRSQTLTNRVTVDLPAGTNLVVLTASNSDSESDPTEPVRTVVPASPTGLRQVIQVTNIITIIVP